MNRLRRAWRIRVDFADLRFDQGPEGVDLGQQPGPFGPEFGREPRFDRLGRAGIAFGACGTRDLLRRECPIVQPRSEHLPAEHRLASGNAMPQAEDDLGSARGKGDQSRRLVRGPVGLSVPVGRNRAILVVHDRDVDRATDCLEFFGSVEAFRPRVILAAGHPAARFALGENDRVKGLAIERLHPDDSAPRLFEPIEPDPGFERFRLQVHRQRAGLGKARRGVQFESVAAEPGLPLECARQHADVILLVLIEVPSCDRGRWGGRKRLACASGLGLRPGGLFDREHPALESGDSPPRRPDVRFQRCHVLHAVPDSGQRGDDAVVIDLANWVELMIMTACAVDRQAEEGLADGADHVLELVLTDHLPHRRALLALPHTVEGPGDQEPGRLDGLRLAGPQRRRRPVANVQTHRRGGPG